MLLCLLGKGTAIALATLCGLEGSFFETRCKQEIPPHPLLLWPAPASKQPPPQWVPGLLPGVIFTISRARLSYGLISTMCRKVRHPWESNPRPAGLQLSAYRTQTTYDILILKNTCCGVLCWRLLVFLFYCVQWWGRYKQFHKYWPAVC